MNIASIDTGTNTVLMLVAEVLPGGKLRVIKEFHNMPRIGEGVFRTGEIREDKIRAMIDIYTQYKGAAEQYDVEKIVACGTNVFRIARNGNYVVARVKEVTGIEMEIIPGEIEAECAFLGATADFDRTQTIAVIDIGGGSTEITCKRCDDLIFQKSFSTGVVTLREHLVDSDRLTAKNISELQEHCRDFFGELKDLQGLSSAAISIAGTPTTLISIGKGLTAFDAGRIHKEFLSLEMIDTILPGFRGVPFAEYSRYGKIINGREDLMGAGAVILSTVLEYLGLKGTYVSVTGLRYGLILRYLANSKTGL